MKILFLALSALLFLGCSDNKKEEDKKVTQAVSTSKAPAKEVAQDITQEKVIVKENVAEEKAALVEAVPKKVAEVKEVKTEVVPKEIAVIQTAKVDGSVVFKKCIACHGANAEKKALNKSQVIQGWNTEKTLTALHGYKDGTYGGAMKSVMKAQISNLSEDELKAVAEHISKL